MTKALVSGANRGIGFEISHQLGKRGFHLILGIRDPNQIQPTINRLVKNGIDKSKLQGIQLDLNNQFSIRKVKESIENNNKDLNLLINNAGISGNMSKGALTTSANEYQKTLNTNFFGNLKLIQALLPTLENNFNSKIVNITGPYEGTKWYNPAAYRISKVALDALIQSFATDFINQGININIFGIFPGGVSTALNNFQNNSFMKDVRQAGKEITNIIINSNQNYNGQIVDTNGSILNRLK